MLGALGLYILGEGFRLRCLRNEMLPSQVFLSPFLFRSKCGERDELSPKRIKVEVWLCVIFSYVDNVCFYFVILKSGVKSY
jgi:hypothetical protein